MADSYNVADVVFSAVKAADTGLVLYQDRSISGEQNSHIVVAIPPMDRKKYVNKYPFVNVNVFIKMHDNGSPNISLMKTIIRSLEKVLNAIVPPEGMYWKSKIVWIEPMGEHKSGFDCTNIRLEVITELN